MAKVKSVSFNRHEDLMIEFTEQLSDKFSDYVKERIKSDSKYKKFLKSKKNE